MIDMFSYFYDNHVTSACATSTFNFIWMSLWTKSNPLKPIIINLPIGKKDIGCELKL